MKNDVMWWEKQFLEDGALKELKTCYPGRAGRQTAWQGRAGSKQGIGLAGLGPGAGRGSRTSISMGLGLGWSRTTEEYSNVSCRMLFPNRVKGRLGRLGLGLAWLGWFSAGQVVLGLACLGWVLGRQGRKGRKRLPILFAELQ
ncbi:hypothetical protein PPACK8108_LOCUS3601 [Phakopsora pachyrhizi]|uniref:Uncharacterized protein n=1 Tax=Phakopsora pachyrhizi TaxID=170000 RepID=A0AAV0AM66_PHAPC|nr:hypothetical protein PPACK8108_LOCUS3601 [Phakopsora pachyrhizi]